MLRSRSVCAVLIALSFLFNKAQGVLWKDFWKKNQVIGYATVSEEQAKLINKDNKLYEGDELHVKRPPYALQTGSGFYILNGPGNWVRSSIDEEERRWYCAIEARKRKMKNIGKIKIPISLWSENEEEIVDYITLTRLVSEPKEALRFSWVKGFKGWQLQMLIPTDVVKKDDLELRARCFASEEELMKFSHVTLDWDAWKAKGYLGKPGPYRLGGSYYGYA
ncbi:hypothetical protein MBM_07127 [Drepanopeziza brunnea f. sp. 'multigermtubi' MB_m1]|uniref:Uncharacterized protein n=1 Tax=Marssonina brunnea f. sp. multigermtubi (strain MB_m1) TaxID=1072389 RepID=K1WPL3_MARBU|nr:uncharacterized protein MBM_07127 [Drepanopeziza brunnea f. sp. 'multigermtubi' MB_m1]EKD14916.1 hypothetical protein MBM_07127 [Drepanopeziza brunnea f. sp. 'multigermtubi' MB_m1]